MIKTKKAQGEVITTVLLILIGIAAVVLVSGFVINLVRSNLKSTDCFETTGQLTIGLDSKYTYFSSGNKTVYINIKRGGGEFNLTGIMISLGNGEEMKTFKIIENGKNESDGVKMYNDTLNISLPSPSGAKTYQINVEGKLDSVDRAKVIPIIYPSKTCDSGSDEKEIVSY